MRVLVFMMERGNTSRYLNQAYLAALQWLKECSLGGFTFSLTESGNEDVTSSLRGNQIFVQEVGHRSVR
jgi:hypothetical protein